VVTAHYYLERRLLLGIKFLDALLAVVAIDQKARMEFALPDARAVAH
jgi:hypothetical protein